MDETGQQEYLAAGDRETLIGTNLGPPVMSVECKLFGDKGTSQPGECSNSIGEAHEDGRVAGGYVQVVHIKS